MLTGLDILKDKWSPVNTVEAVLVSLRSLLGEPNNESPLNSQAAEMWEAQEQYREFNANHYKTHSKK
jgi:ubiquitin-conjugating enzyme E2 C